MYIARIHFYFLIFSLCLILSCRQSDTLFEALPASKTNIDFTNELRKTTDLNIISYLYYYNGGGVSVGDVNNDGLTDIYFTANSKGNNKLYLNTGKFQFEDVTVKAGVSGKADWCSGVTMADVNGDGYLDIYVSAVSNAFGLKGHNQLFINNGVNAEGEISFTESAENYGLAFSGLSTQAAFFDFDHDGDLDCYLLNHSQNQVANIPDTINRRSKGSISGDRFYRNDLNTATRKFTDITAQAGIFQSNLGYGLGLAIADFNNDGWDDVYVGNDFFENDYYYVNNGNGTFTESGGKHFEHYSRFSMGNDAADYNNDGQIDIITTDMLPYDEKLLKTYGSDENPDTYKRTLRHNGYQYQYSKNCLQQNNGSGSSFSEQSLLAGVSATDWSWCPLFVDFDNDGAKDLLITNGIVKWPMDLDYMSFFNSIREKGGIEYETALEKMPDGSSNPFVFKGDGHSRFQDVSSLWGTKTLKGYFNGAAYADFDNDGNVDVIINSIDNPATILKNNAVKKNFISLAFKGSGMNTYGIGAKAYIYQNNKLQYQQLMLTRGFQSSSDTRLHFGLDSENSIDSLLVVWPDQSFELIKDLQGNKILLLQQKNATATFHYDRFFKKEKLSFTVLNSERFVDWKHQENDFNDFNVQYLIPHAQSTRGPKLAIADVNADGLVDFYACGAKEQAGALMIQQKDGTYLPADEPLFKADARSEDVDAAFFDANGDGYIDLYVVSGGNEITGENQMLLDRLYVNDGKGHFVKAINAMPAVFANKSCLSVADVDKDGDIDIFIGHLADANAYGVPQTSALFINDGKGAFSIAAENIIELSHLGMVTSAAFADINKDGWVDLIVAGEWMPITLFLNKAGKFQKEIVPNSTGWWQSILVDDVNSDGQLDILAGNWGLNNKFWSDKDGPVKLYVSDFDKNGSTDQLLSYTKNGKDYPFLAKDEIERAIPIIRKRFLLYADYAGVEMQNAFKGYVEKVTPLQAERLGSVVCFGDGKGSFAIKELPDALQLAPIFAFQNIPSTTLEKNYLCAGNFFDVLPFEGRYDAQPLAYFSCTRNNIIQPLSQTNLRSIKGQFRDIKWLQNAKHGPLIIAAGNNEKLLFLRPQ